MGSPRWTSAAVLATVITAGVPPELPGAEERPDPPNEEPEDLTWPLPLSETPIADSVERAVERFIREHLSSCPTSEGVPCFPVTVELKGHQYSVRETLENLELDSRPMPGPPTAGEMIQHGANPRPTSATVGFDPKSIVCKTRQLLRNIQGKSRRYYLYRVWDEAGERAVLRDRPLNPEEFAGNPQFQYEPLGEFGDECEAIQAYRQRTHDVRVRREAQAAETEGSAELRAPPGPP